MEPDRHRGYAFGDFVLDLDRCALLKSGHDVGLEPHHLHVLALLVEHPGRPVARERILTDVWGKTDPDPLEQCIDEIRSVIDAGQESSTLALGADGYRFERDVEPLEELAIPPTLGKRKHLEPFALGLIALIVLMFVVLWLSEG